MSINDRQTDLFGSSGAKTPAHSHEASVTNQPLAYRARPNDFNNFIGQKHIFQRYPFLKSGDLPSLILWGPPGVGKTTLARILSENSKKDMYNFNAVLGGVKDLKKIIDQIIEVKKLLNKDSVLFIDEIHRFNKAQQDALLPYVERGAFTFIGATTENPRTSVNRALLSRVRTIELKQLSEPELFELLENVNKNLELSISQEVLEVISDYSGGDARNALNSLELVLQEESPSDVTGSRAKELLIEESRNYDKNKNRHYDVISAFIKSMRGSDPQAALLWLAVMLDGGEDPAFIARRLVIFASEDVGNADPSALGLAVAALHAVQHVGMPEARISLAHATTYLASTVKSNAAYKGIDAALEFVHESPPIEVPLHLRNYPPKDAKVTYQYPHSFPNHFVEQDYTNEELPNFYAPTEQGREKLLKERLAKLYPNRDY